MLIFKDIVSGNEMFSDVYDPKLVDDVVYEVDCKMITVDAVNVGADATVPDTGANASAEDAEEALEDGPTKVNDIIYSFRLQSSSFDKKSYLSHLKGFFKAVKEHKKSQGASEEDVKAWEKKAGDYVKNKLLPNFKDFEFYIGEEFNPDGMVALLNYREDGITPFFTFWKDGLTEMKC
ncbi:translationally controlled tumor protein [Pyricularia oryzae Y34]|uniref:Translationally-controlled tumor protein homolog n=1 Tax=Pyricularia oryzae (strain Y34) TaxID=1143189 RepID=A0AA97NR01_PYRO3|nr:translationally controlled tumor protein [Pyricularia oryzae Y34]